MNSPVKRLIRLTLALAVVGCGPEPEPVPTPPSTAALVAQFDQIDGVLDEATAVALVEGLVADLVVIAAAAALVAEVDAARAEVDDAEIGTGALTAAPAEADEQTSDPRLGTRRDALTAEAGAWARLTYICPGADRAVVDDANGALVLRTVLDDLDERLVLWGDARDCVVDTGTDEGLATLDAAVLAHYVVDADALYARLDGALRSVAADRPFSIDLVREADVTRLYRVVDGGSFVIGIEGLETGALDAGVLTVADRDGVWRCSYVADAASGVCERGAEVVQWP